MGVYMPNIKPPKDEPGAFKVIVMYVGADGKLRAECEGTHELVSVPPHGRVIDADVLFEKVYKAWGTEYDAGESNWFMDMINEAPTIIPATMKHKEG